MFFAKLHEAYKHCKQIQHECFKFRICRKTPRYKQPITIIRGVFRNISLAMNNIFVNINTQVSVQTYFLKFLNMCKFTHVKKNCISKTKVKSYIFKTNFIIINSLINTGLYIKLKLPTSHECKFTSAVGVIIAGVQWYRQPFCIFFGGK